MQEGALTMQVPNIDDFMDQNERRVDQHHTDLHWYKLSIAQRFAFYTLTKIGYQLLFVRKSNHESTAVARQDGRLVTIDNEGDIDFNPSVALRESRH